LINRPITQEEAEMLMLQFCTENNYYFSLPVKIINRWQSWKLISNYGQNGNNAWISINKKTRKVIDGGFSIAMNRDIAIGITKKVCRENNWIFCDQGLSLIDDSPYWSIWAIIKYKPEGCLVIRTDEITITISQKTGEVISAGNPPR
jgi:hypothetical protein